jgi:hypothetical protein
MSSASPRFGHPGLVRCQEVDKSTVQEGFDNLKIMGWESTWMASESNVDTNQRIAIGKNPLSGQLVLGLCIPQLLSYMLLVSPVSCSLLVIWH